MAATFLDSWKLAIFIDGTSTPDAPDFRRRVQLAAVKIAKQVQGEIQSTRKTTQWMKRAAFATTLLSIHIVGDPPSPKAGSEIWLDTLALATALNPVIVAGSADGDIEFQLTAVWDDLAGVTGQNLAEG